MTIAHRRERTNVHPLYELRERVHKLEQEIISTNKGDTEALIQHLLTQNMLIRGLIAVAIANWEMK